jgi:hypothetical protein
LKGILPAIYVFLGGVRLHLLQIAIFSRVEENICTSPKKIIYVRSCSM